MILGCTYVGHSMVYLSTQLISQKDPVFTAFNCVLHTLFMSVDMCD
jgi:hypothetical protein